MAAVLDDEALEWPSPQTRATSRPTRRLRLSGDAARGPRRRRRRGRDGGAGGSGARADTSGGGAAPAAAVRGRCIQGRLPFRCQHGQGEQVGVRHRVPTAAILPRPAAAVSDPELFPAHGHEAAWRGLGIVGEREPAELGSRVCSRSAHKTA
jgi:hypothetical protein